MWRAHERCLLLLLLLRLRLLVYSSGRIVAVVPRCLCLLSDSRRLLPLLLSGCSDGTCRSCFVIGHRPGWVVIIGHLTDKGWEGRLSHLRIAAHQKSDSRTDSEPGGHARQASDQETAIPCKL